MIRVSRIDNEGIYRNVGNAGQSGTGSVCPGRGGESSDEISSLPNVVGRSRIPIQRYISDVRVGRIDYRASDELVRRDAAAANRIYAGQWGRPGGGSEDAAVLQAHNPHTVTERRNANRADWVR